MKPISGKNSVSHMVGGEVAGTNFILVVDDDPDMLTLLGRMVELSGYEVAQARNGVEALRLIAERTPDVIILDIMMSNIDGWTLYAKLREMTAVPVIFLTAWRTGENAKRARDLGERFASKPIALDELRKLITEALEESHSLSAE